MTRILPLAVLVLSCVPAVAEDGWVEMFNGKDLTGWKVNEDGDFEVKDGAIVAQGERSHCFYMGKEYTDFVLEAEVMTEPGSNSGIFFHTKYQDEGWPSVGHEVQVNNTFSGDPVRSGSLYYRVKLFEPAFKDGEWAKYRITVQGKSLRTEINDRLLYEYVQPPGTIEGPQFGSGLIALQAHDPKSITHYRNLRIKSLDGEKK